MYSCYHWYYVITSLITICSTQLLGRSGSSWGRRAGGELVVSCSIPSLLSLFTCSGWALIHLCNHLWFVKKYSLSNGRHKKNTAMFWFLMLDVAQKLPYFATKLPITMTHFYSNVREITMISWKIRQWRLKITSQIHSCPLMYFKCYQWYYVITSLITICSTYYTWQLWKWLPTVRLYVQFTHTAAVPQKKKKDVPNKCSPQMSNVKG